ncbi:DUF302 domain-containing protein [Chitinophaga agri]|uniref:DUF302 domain-containing protein n=1 Tax=Chitinophaga agri TaxID=2703787 RepID=A0A6B9ZA35_9BACT|nr:DUF302 domain-containing protein [Chitinophaga agri]QHS58906.1 DUF302 domain-containing protein [Chitinophaga agri]
MYHLSKTVHLNFTETIGKVTDELKKEGFGVITSIDLKETFRKKINVIFRNYIILGACNPDYAHKALLLNDKVGVFLPCNIVVQEHTDGKVEVSVVNPEEMVERIYDPNLTNFASEVRASMERVLGHL